MQWTDVIAPPPEKTLRQFAVLCLLVFGSLAAWRLWHGQTGMSTSVLAGLGLSIGGLGLIRPTAIRFIYTGWMIAAFPVGWTISKVVLGLVFIVVFTPVAVIFRLMGRDTLGLGRRAACSYWVDRRRSTIESVFRQS